MLLIRSGRIGTIAVSRRHVPEQNVATTSAPLRAPGLVAKTHASCLEQTLAENPGNTAQGSRGAGVEAGLCPRIFEWAAFDPEVDAVGMALHIGRIHPPLVRADREKRLATALFDDALHQGHATLFAQFGHQRSMHHAVQIGAVAKHGK